MAKKITIGTLEAKDNGQFDREEIIMEIVDRMQKYVTEANALVTRTDCTTEEKYNAVKSITNRFSGLSNFLNETLKIEIRNPASGMLYTQEMFNRIYYHEMALRAEVMKGGKTA